MSKISSGLTHPFEIVHHPTLEPEVKRFILASWASDAAAITGEPALRQPAEIANPVPIEDVLAALRALDGEVVTPTRH